MKELLSAMAALMADARLMIDDEGYRQILSDSIDRAEKAYESFASMQQGVSSIDVVTSYQDTCNWSDNTMLALLCEFIDSKGLSKQLQELLESALIEGR